MQKSITEKVLLRLNFFISLVVNIFSKVILGLFFICVIMPISLFLRIFGYDPLRIKKNDSQTFKEYKKNYSKINFKKLF